MKLSSHLKVETTDPVCGMTVAEDSPLRVSHRDTIYLFCSEDCRRKFTEDPSRHLKEPATLPAEAGHKRRGEGRGTSWRDYIPLMVIIGLTLGAAAAKQAHYPAGWDWMSWMHDFMGFFLVVFSMFKFFDMEGFADGFQMYDLLARKARPYAYLYPFLELGLGLGYLAHFQPVFIYSATVILMTFGSFGVFNALRKGLDLTCACMGTVLHVPLSTVALVEDLGMAAMAAVMLVMVLAAF
jgi:YHS domain-containing protein